MMGNEIFILSAGERLNYGDLLFPHIISKVFGERKDLVYRNFGLINSDLSKVGAIPTESLRRFYNSQKTGSRNRTVIVAGGEVLGPGWSDLLKCDSFIFNQLTRQKYFRSFLNLNAIAKAWLGGKTDHAYIMDKKVIDAKIIYNSVGGNNLPYHDSKKMSRIIQLLESADYFSVRDSFTFQSLKSAGMQNIYLVPDCAVLISELYDRDFLRRKISKKNADKINNLKNRDYVFFQVNRKLGEKYFERLYEFLSEIYSQYRLQIVLCPIGKALSHEDEIPLRNISLKLRAHHQYLSEVNIWEIMYLISNAKLFIGSSLHGVITAMSFTVPYLGLFEESIKVGNYIKTWGVEGLDKCYSESEILLNFKEVVSTPKEILKCNTNEQAIKVIESFNRIKEIIYS